MRLYIALSHKKFDLRKYGYNGVAFKTIL